MSGLWCGIDWAERHPYVAVVDDSGFVVLKERITDDAAGFTRRVEMIVELRTDGLRGLPIKIETAQGLLVAALRASAADLFTINPLAVSRYRDRYSPSRAKSDTGDAIVLANILRTDMDNHRRLPADSVDVQAIRCSHGRIRTRSGTVNRSRARRVHFCGNTFRRSCRRSRI